MHHHTDVRRTALKIAAVFFAVLLLLSGVLLALSLWERSHGAYTGAVDKADPIKTYAGETYKLKDRVETMLLLGLDAYENEGGDAFTNDKQADFLLLLVMDNATGVCKAIHINRDTMAQVDVLGVAGDRVATAQKQIALAHTYGNGREVSCRNTANAVSHLLGVEIDHYLSVTMDAVAVFNDLVGGVSVDVLDDMTAMDPALIQGQTVTLSGSQALTYVRARYGLEDPTNAHRMQRQKQYLEALYERARQCMAADETFVSHAALTLADYMVSDCSGNRLESMLSRFAENRLETIYSPEGRSVAGQQFMEFYPDAASVEQIVIDCFYEKAK